MTSSYALDSYPTYPQGGRESILKHFIYRISSFDSACNWLHPPLEKHGTDCGNIILVGDEPFIRYAIILEQADRFKLWGHDFHVTSSREEALFGPMDSEVISLLEKLEQELDIKSDWRDIPAIRKTIDEIYYISNKSQGHQKSSDSPETSTRKASLESHNTLRSGAIDELSQTSTRRVIFEDVLEQHKASPFNCIMRYNEEVVDRSLKSKPLQRRPVKVPRPSSYCGQMLRRNWICSQCQTLVEYGYIDDLLYCDCGACYSKEWEFKCKDPRHGSAWERYDESELLRLLKALDPFEELNILILGESGVGKSTWINAFINYLAFESLDEALLGEDLKWVIPCSFTIQLKDESDSQGRFVQKCVRIGSSKSESDTPYSRSATQPISVYTVDISSTRVRLINTPGIGDTRGVEKDNENMADILRVLRSYNNLHGILIFLKSNTVHLEVMFRFYIKQLLTYLHGNAANNIAFGFTNTRRSNFMPGDTLIPLEALLNEYNEVKIGISVHNVYYFDSESFRYLAARRNEVDIDHLEDDRRSWEYSVGECKRLVKHFQGLKPHQVRSAINLNETCHIILQLAKPMVLISQQIQRSIAANERQIKELQDNKSTRDQLMKNLYIDKQSDESVLVDQPIIRQERGGAVGRGFASMASAIDIKAEAIRMKKMVIEEFKLEFEQLQDAATQFGFFLEKYAITSYHDATVKYMDQQIDEEKNLVAIGHTKDRLNLLNKCLIEYMEKIKTLEENMKSSSHKLLDNQGISQLLDGLYGLKHFGDALRNTTQFTKPPRALLEKDQSTCVLARIGMRRLGSRLKGLGNMLQTLSLVQV